MGLNDLVEEFVGCVEERGGLIGVSVGRRDRRWRFKERSWNGELGQRTTLVGVSILG